MKTWILYKQPTAARGTEAYEVRRLVDVSRLRGLDATVYAPEQFELLVTRDDPRSVRIDGASVDLPDVMLPRMGAGTTYFALAVIRQLERLRVPTFNTSTAIETVKDKLFTHQILAQNKMPIPKTMLAKFPVDIDLVQSALGFPVVVKTLSGTQGSGVFLCEDRRKFDELMQLIHATQANANMIVQEFVADSLGRDVRLIVVGGRIVAAMERRASDGGFKANFSQGGEVLPWSPDRDAEWLALESTRVLNLDIAGIDLLFDGDGYKVCEANSSPGFEGMELCCSVDVATEIMDFVCFRLDGRKATVSRAASRAPTHLHRPDPVAVSNPSLPELV